MESSITSNFSSTSGNAQGSIGKDYRVKYSFIAFSGVVSGRNAKKTGLTDEDLKLLDKAMKNAIPLNVTRTKINQYPRLYIRLEYKDTSTVLGDMRKHVKLIKDTEEESIRDISELKLDITQLVNLFDRNKSKIEKIYYFACDELKLVYNDQPVELAEVLKDFNVSLVE
ncbi:MAG TPA: type I CRISPR-associated protein Cas7, partial [Petrotogaceae bacterium]|nr:type I CRISPR-associated protein Cas7 [Petrotogaceae bacterium]